MSNLERKPAEEALAATTARLNALIDTAMDAIISIDAGQRIVLFNPAAERMFGMSAREALGQDISRFIPESARAAHARHVESYGKTGATTRRMGRLGKISGLRATGEQFPIEASIARVQLEGEMIFTVILRDITRRERDEQTRARLAAIVESSQDAILSENPEGLVITWNAAAERLFGYAATQIIGQPVALLIPPSLQEQQRAIIERLRQGEHVETFESVRLTCEQEPIDVSAAISLIRDANGAVIGVSTILHDITEHKQAEAKLQAYADTLEKTVAERTTDLRRKVAELEAFSYTLSHDLRAPIRAIQSFSGIALKEFGEKAGPASAELLQRVVRAAGRMDALIQDVLTLSQLAKDQVTVAPVDVERLLGEIIAERPEFRSNAEIRLQAPLLPVLGHEASLSQCLTNLLSNAVKFVAPGVRPQVRVWTEAVHNPESSVRNDSALRAPHSVFVRLCIADNGIGIPSEMQGKIFEIFQRLPQTTKYEGTGIGLAIVRKAAERMGGKVGVDSELGTGSRFWIELPSAQPIEEDAA